MEEDKEKAGKKRFGEWKVKALIKNWLLVMIWMGGIYWGSSQPALPGPVSSPSWEGLLFRNALHFIEYAILATLLWRALANTCRSQMTARPSENSDPSPSIPLSSRWVLPLAFSIALLYALFDEWHQGSVANRAAALFDVGTDMVGVVTALGVILIWWRSPK